MNQKIGILGYGEVGKAIAKFYSDPKIKDLDQDDGLEGIEILNICIPWSDNFIDIAKEEIQKIGPKLTIIHSTVEVGTTKKIYELTNKLVVHSPIRGVHPELYEGAKTFIKYVGTDDREAGELAKEHLESIGMKVTVFEPSATTEIGKLLSTSYYGLCIAWHGEMKRMCDELGVDFEKAVTDFNKTYNEGYEKLGMPDVRRPVLYPPKDFIGGHCVVPNAKILSKKFKSLVFDLILKYSKRDES